MDYSVVILCAGSGRRTGLEYNKMFYLFENHTIYEMTLDNFIKDKRCTQIIVVCKNEEREDFSKLNDDDRIEFVMGGKERQDSVYNGLKVVKNKYVFIHDGARPFLKSEYIDKLLKEVIKHEACLLMVPCKDTIKVVENNKVVKTLEREKLMHAQTPQVFLTSLIKEAYQKGIQSNESVTDDASMVEMFMDHDVYVVIGDYDNKKVTTKEDLK